MANNNFEESDSIILPGVRLDFFDLWTAGKPQNEKDVANPKKWKFKAKVIFDKGSEADKRAQAGMVVAAKKLWGENYANVIRTLAKNSIALRNGDDNLDNNGAVREAYVGMKYVSCSNGGKPEIVAPRRHNGKFINISADGRGFVDGVELNPPPFLIVAPYRGCYVNLKLKFVAGKGMTAPDGSVLPNQIFGKLEAVQFLRDGEAFAGGGSNSAEGFDEVGEVETAAAGGDGLFS